MNVLVCGPRDCKSTARIGAHLAALFLIDKPDVLIHGAATGIDLLADEWAKKCGIPRRPFPVTKAEWNKFGRAAGPRRNQQMLDEGKPHLVVAFQYKDRKTPGTQDMIRRAKKAGVRVSVVEI